MSSSFQNYDLSSFLVGHYSTILEIDNVQDVAAFGEKHNILGNIVVAKIVLNEPESVESVKKRVRQACLKKFSSFKAPTKVVKTEGVLHSSRQKKSDARGY